MKEKILVVDDAELNRDLLKLILEEQYSVVTAQDGEAAIQRLEEQYDSIGAILLDLQMPKKDGFDVLKAMREQKWIEKIPVLVISGERSVDIENKCFELGVTDFIHKPFESSLVKSRVQNAVDLFSYKNNLEEKVRIQTAKLRESNEKIIDILGTVVEYRNLESGQHIKRVKGFTKLLAQRLMADYPEYALDRNRVEIIVAASSLHDIGKIAIPDNILLKPGRLTVEEFECIKSHTTRGCDIIDSIEGIWEDDYRKVSYDICRHHHERFDGKGYPDGLKGDDIPISAQIVSVADVYDALVCERVYKDAIPKDEAFHMILNGACGIFSPKLMECLKNVREEFEKLADEMK